MRNKVEPGDHNQKLKLNLNQSDISEYKIETVGVKNMGKKLTECYF